VSAISFFITGTDTGVGKTEVTIALLRAGRGLGLRVAGFKPVATGAALGPSGGLENGDALRLLAEASLPLAYGAVNPYVFAAPIAPHLAAAAAGVAIDLARIQRGWVALAAQVDLLLVEGVGGYRVPLGPHATVASLAATLQVPLILVVGLRLGCINHGALSFEAIERDGLPFAGWVGAQVDPDYGPVAGTLDALTAAMGQPPLGLLPMLGYGAARGTAEVAAAALRPVLLALLAAQPRDQQF
jgi:dethiobiotin synthetase